MPSPMFVEPSPFGGPAYYPGGNPLPTIDQLLGPARPAANPFGTFSLSGSTFNSTPTGGDPLASLYSQLQNMSPVATQTTVQQQNRSPELEESMRQYMAQLAQRSAQTTGAYQGLQNTYGDLIRNLSTLYYGQGNRAAQAAAQSALGSGLSPLEATGAANDVLMQVLQQYFPARAGMTVEAGNVPVQAQQALAGLQQNLWLPFLQNVEAPYREGVAGSTGTTTTNDPLRTAGLLAQLAQAMSNRDIEGQRLSISQQDQSLGWARLAQEARLAAAENALRQFLGMAELGTTQRGQSLAFLGQQLGNQSELERQRMVEAEAMRRLEMTGAQRTAASEQGFQQLLDQMAVSDQYTRGLERFRNDLVTPAQRLALHQLLGYPMSEQAMGTTQPTGVLGLIGQQLRGLTGITDAQGPVEDITIFY